MKFFSTLLLGLVAAVIGASIQQRTWRHRALVELKEKEHSEARKAVEELSQALDLRLEAQRTYTSLAMNDKLTDDDIGSFKKATTAWMGGFSTNKSKIYHSFGRSAVLDFERYIQEPLQYASAIVSLGLRHGVDNLCTRDRLLFQSSEYKLNIIQYEIYKFLNELNDRIANGEIGRTRAINNLSENDYSMVSRIYLVRRLLGIEGNISRTY